MGLCSLQAPGKQMFVELSHTKMEMLGYEIGSVSCSQ